METILSKTVLVLAAIMSFSTGAHAANLSIDTDTPDGSPSNPASVEFTDTGIIFTKAPDIGSGSGTFTRLFKFSDRDGKTDEGVGFAEAYNYDGPNNVPFDQDGANGFEPHVEMGSLPVVTINGKQYIQFILDSAGTVATNGTRTLYDFRVYIVPDTSNTTSGSTASPFVTTETQLNATQNTLGTLVYSFNPFTSSGVTETNTLVMKMDSGNGMPDVAFNVPLENFMNAGAKTTDNVYAWIKINHANGTFSEFATAVPEGTPIFSSLVPEPTTVGGGLTLLALAGSGMIRRRHRQAHKSLEHQA